MKQRKRRKKSTRQLIAFAFKGWRKRKYEVNFALHRHEQVIILRDAIKLGGSFDHWSLHEEYPGRYDSKTLKAALKRMQGQNLLVWGDSKGRRSSFSLRNRGPYYEVRAEIAATYASGVHDSAAA